MPAPAREIFAAGAEDRNQVDAVDAAAGPLGHLAFVAQHDAPVAGAGWAAVSVKPAIVVVVFPRYRAVLPSVMAVAKLLSSCDSGIADVAVAKVYGTVMLEPHS